MPKLKRDYFLRREDNQIRQSQLITPFGTGALTDILNQSVMVAGSEFWNSRAVEDNKFYDVRLQRAMKAEGFVAPPTSEGFIAVKTFPTWYSSPSSSILKQLWRWRADVKNTQGERVLSEFDRQPYEIDPRGYRNNLVPVRIVCACRAGHVQDFPWYEWAHSAGTGNKETRHHTLKLSNNGGSGTIADLVVSCSCGKWRSLQGIFGDGAAKILAKIQVTCHGQYGWKRTDPHTKCHENLIPIMRNSNSLYFPNVDSSVNIPFEENATFEQIQNTEHYRYLTYDLEDYDSIEGKIEALKAKHTQRKLHDIAAELFKEDEVSEKEIQIIRDQIIENFKATQNSDSKMTQTDYRQDEYLVLTGEKQFDKDNGRLDLTFKNPDSFPDNEPIAQYFKKITLLNQLEVVNVLRSYSRIRPIESDWLLEQEESEREEHGDESDRASTEVSLRRRDNVFVGLKNKGEGIFIAIDSNQLKIWRQRIFKTQFAARVLGKLHNKGVKEYMLPFVDPVFYLLHTLSHLMIRELSFASGYSSSALRERLYYSDGSNEKDMCGFLIYTSSADSEGTLGGLVRQGLPENLFKMLEAALEKARWCSYDPTCIDNLGQGRNSLNLAACHACALVSETSCERMNLFLDRGMLVGTLEEPDLVFFSGIL